MVYSKKTIQVRHGKAVPKSSGFSLVELLVGVVIGLFVVLVSLGTIVSARISAGAISDMSGLQQQASIAFRKIGMQIRQAGSLHLELNPTAAQSPWDRYSPVYLEALATNTSGGKSFDPRTDAIQGGENHITVASRYHRENLFSSSSMMSQLKNCIGGPSSDTRDLRMESKFRFEGATLECSGNGSKYQAIAENVANFSLRYAEQKNHLGRSAIRYSSSASVSNWENVVGVEICLVLFGREGADILTGSSYEDCPSETGASDLVEISQLGGTRSRRLHAVFRNVFNIRSQGSVS